MRWLCHFFQVSADFCSNMQECCAQCSSAGPILESPRSELKIPLCCPCCLQSLDQLGFESSSTCPFPLYQEKLYLQFQTLPSRWQFGLQKPFKTSLISKTVLRMKIHPKLKQDTYIHTYAHLLLNLSYWHRFKSMIIPTVGQGLGKRVAFIRCWWECKLV